MIARGIRNNNPLNIKYSAKNAWKGKVKDEEKEDPVFEEFTSMGYGLRAALKIIRNQCMREGGCTPRSIIRRWAPPGVDGNPTEAYISYVQRRMKELLVDEWDVAESFNPALKVSFSNYPVMRALITAMSEFESKYSPEVHDFRWAWNNL